jgi:hypothetical protein
MDEGSPGQRWVLWTWSRKIRHFFGSVSLGCLIGGMSIFLKKWALYDVLDALLGRAVQESRCMYQSGWEVGYIYSSRGKR